MCSDILNPKGCMTQKLTEVIDSEILKFRKAHKKAISITWSEAKNGIYIKMKEDPDTTGFTVGDYFAASKFKVGESYSGAGLKLELAELYSLLLNGVSKRKEIKENHGREVPKEN